MKTIFEMETGDPDDYLTLLFLIGNPKVDIIGVNISPGSWDQVSVVKQAFKRFGIQNIPVGSFVRTDDDKKRVSAWHYKIGLDSTRVAPDMIGADLLDKLFAEDVTLLTGSPMKNIGAFIERQPQRRLGRIIVQGGFAGDGVVPDHLQLEKFAGKKYVPSFNLNGDIKSANLIINSDLFLEKRFVSKNVCHNVMFDDEIKYAIYRRLRDLSKKRNISNLLIQRYLNTFVQNCPDGKKLHDLLAAACAIDPSIAEWRKVNLHRKSGGWGCELDENSDLDIIINYNKERFIDVLVCKE
jgi:inosine-uridine nucleoside N-ribohydrolase